VFWGSKDSVAIRNMDATTSYLDAHDLAVILEVTPATILKRAKARPQSLPPPAYLGPNFPLRWRRDDAIRWLAESSGHGGDECLWRKSVSFL